MKTAVVLLICCWLVTNTTESCPDNFNCYTQRDTFGLRCKPVLDHLQFKIVNGTVDEVPTGATHVKISCFDRRIPVNLKFAYLPNIRKLTLQHLNITTLNEQMFRGIANISYLVMNKLFCKRFEKYSFNGLTNLRSLEIEDFDELEYMHPDMLKPLEALQSLSFRYIGSKRDALNYTDYGRVLGGINSTRFETLVLYAIHSVHHQETQLNITDLFRHGSVGVSLKHLDLGRNNIGYFRGSPAIELPVLEYISLGENVIVGSRGWLSLSPFWMGILTHPRLATLEIIGMNLAANTFSNVSFSLNVDADCSRAINITLGTQLRLVSFYSSTFISNSLISLLPICFIDPLRSFRYIDFSNLHYTQSVTISLAQFHALEYFNVKNVHLREFAIDIFHKMPNLTVLIIGKNDIGNIISSDTESCIFRNNNKLLVLDLAACHLTYIPQNEFIALQQLLSLDVSRNELLHFYVDLHTMRNLQILDLSDNKLTTLSAKTRTELDEMATVQVDISGNPLHCLCNNTDFVTWIHTSKKKFLNKYATFCIDENNSTNLLFFVDSEKLINVCHPYYLYCRVYLHLILVVIALMAICVVSIYRWKCVHLCSRPRTVSVSPDVELDPVVYERDAFICYNSNDREWVLSELLTRLEKNNISSIIHDIDFLPGASVINIIGESMERSRFTVLVLSPDFLSSNWCLFELDSARTHAISRGRDVIVPIILREFPTAPNSRHLADIFDKSYLKWTDDKEGQSVFWDKLITKLKHGGNITRMKN